MAQFNVNLAFNADTGKAKTQIQELQSLLSKIAYTGTTSPTKGLQTDLQAASAAAKELQFHLNNAFNTSTGNFDLSLLDRSLKTSGSNIQVLSTQLLNAGATGQQAFLKLAQSISLADQPMLRISKRMQDFAVTMKNTVKWQLSSSMLHGFMGAIQSAYGYAKDLNKSLNNIRIVTGYNTDKMAEFAEQANKAAKNLSTTTTDYTNASLIYFQQGLSDEEVTARTDITVKMANAVGQSAEVISEQLTAVWNNFDDGSKSLEYYADVMTALGAATASSSDEISEGLSKFAAVAGSVGLSYEYATSALATLTSNTRESADVVGNALKTLFARIQGLKLGETLDDGTDLNKYSAALESVGVSIYDANGSLKDMDDILDEMAAKWENLNDTQQVALAQTVAGVRQYNQLIALMENWNNGDSDSMMANLNTIGSSEGALQEQADIYAESWEAAEKRVQAAAEGIYQSLLDDDFFITLTNGFANVLNGMDAFIDGAGGIKTILSGIAGFIISTFANKIPQALDTFKYNLKFITKGVQSAYDDIQSDIQKATNLAFSGFVDKTTGKQVMPIQQDSATGYAIEQANKLTAARNKLALVSDKMSASEKQMAETQLSIIETLQQQTVTLKQRNEELQKTANINLNEINSAILNSDIGIGRGQSVQSKLGQYPEGNHVNIGLNADDLAQMQEASIELSQTISTQIVGQLDSAEVASKGLTDSFTGMVNVFSNAEVFEQQFKSISMTLEQLSQTQLPSVQFDEVRTQVQEFVKILPEGVSGLEDIRKQINLLGRAKNIQDLEKEFKKLKSVLSKIKIDAKNVGKALEGSADSKQVKTLISTIKELGVNTGETTSKMKMLEAQLNNFQPTHVIRLSEAFGNLTGLLTNSISTIGSVISAFKTLENPNLSGWEKFSSVITGVGFAFSGAMNSIKDFKNLQNFLSQSLMRAAGASADYGQMIGSMNNAIQIANLNIPKAARSLNDEEKATMKAAMASLFKGKIDQDGVVGILAKIYAEKGMSNTVAETTAKEVIYTAVKEASAGATWKQVAAQMGLNVAMLPYIAIIAAVAATLGIIIGLQKQEAERARENAKAAREKAKASQEQVDSNQKLVDSYQEVLNAYNETKEAFANGQATIDDLTSAQNSLADSAFEVAKALGVQGAALAKLSGDYNQLTEDIIAAQKEDIKEARENEQNAYNLTGTEFIADMRAGKGYNAGGVYSADFLGGMSTNDETFFKTVDYDQFQYLHSYGNGEFYLSSGQDIDSMIGAYEEVQELYNQALTNMTADEMNKSEVFQKIKNYLDKSSESYKAYKASEENIQKYDIQLASYKAYGNNNNAYDISSVEDYDKYASAMIKDIANTKGIVEGTTEWDELTKAVHAYLGALEGVSAFATQSQAFDEIVKKTGLAKDKLLEYYNELETDGQKELFFKIAFNRTQTVEELNEELELLQAIANGESLKVKIDVVSEGLSLLDDDATTEEIVAWAKKMKEAYGEAFNLEEFLSFSSDDQVAYLQGLKSNAESAYAGNRDQQIKEYQEAIARAQEDMSNQESAWNQASDDRIANQSRLTELQDYKNQYNQAISKGETFNFASLGEAGITDITSLNNAITATEDLINANNEIIGSYEELGNQVSNYKQEIENLEMEKQVEEAYGWRDALQDQAEAFDINYNEVKEYAEYLRKNNGYINDVEESEKLALAYKKQSKAIDDLGDNYKDYAKVLNKAKKDQNVKNTEEYSKAIKSLQKDLSLLTGISEDAFSDEFLNSTKVQRALSNIANGVGNVEDNIEAIMKEYRLTVVADIKTEEAQTEVTNLLSQMQSILDSTDLKVGMSLDEAGLSGIASAFQALLDSGTITVQQLTDIFKSFQFSPEVTWEPVPVGSVSNQAVGYYYRDSMGNYVEWDGQSTSASDGFLYMPKINSKASSYTGAPPTVPNKTGGGGQKKHAEKKNDSGKERYHTLQNQLEDLTAEYDKISEAADRAFGKDKLKKIDEEIKATDDLIAKQEKYIDAISQDLPKDKAIMESYYKKVIGGPAIEFDESGNISNFDAIQDAMYKKYNEMAKKYTEDSKEWQTFEKQYEQMEKYLEQYEETYDLLRDEEAKYQEYLNQRLDLQLAKVEYSVQLKLDISQDDLDIIEYQFDLLEDKAFASAERITKATEKANNLYSQMLTNRDALEDTLGLSLTDQEMALMMNGNMSVLNGKTFTQDQMDAIKNYRDSLLDLNTELVEVQKQIEEEVMTAFDEWHEKLDEGIDKFDHYRNMLDSYQNIVDIVGKDVLGLDNTAIAELSQAQVENAISELESLREVYESYQKSADEAENKMLESQRKAAEARALGDEETAKSYEEDAEFWEETYTEMNKSAQEAQESMMDGWGNTLESIVSQFELAVERAVEAFNEAVYGLGGLSGLSDEFSRQQEMADMYLDDYKQIYELSKLSRDINNSIDDTENLGGKQKLKKLLEEINKIQEDGLEMSQYDLEYLQAEYNLRLAEIELEEAQKAKDTVRLSRDNEGNWSYVYTQNTDAVDSAQQKYEDALYAMQDLSSNYIDEMSEKLISTSQEMQEALANVRVEDYANIEDYYAEIARIEAQYNEQLKLQEAELQKAIDNNKVLYEQDWTNYSTITGYKIADAENFAQAFSDTLLGSLIGSEETTANFANIIGEATDVLVQNLAEAAANYYANLNSAMEAAGTSTSEFADLLAEDIESIKADSEEAADAIAEMAERMDEEMTKITDRVQQWQEDYGHEIDKIIAKNLEIIESFNDMLETLSVDPDQINVTYDIRSNPDSANVPDDTASASTGMYTGEWGDEGRVAILHEKELVLNQDDTANMLQMLELTRYMLSVIDTNAKQMSLGVGNLQAASLENHNNEILEQQVSIIAEFPNATNHNEIEEAFNDLINRAAQYANRK